jgi:hypothetical protein
MIVSVEGAQARPSPTEYRMGHNDDRQYAYEPIARIGKAANPSFVWPEPVAQARFNPSGQQ